MKKAAFLLMIALALPAFAQQVVSLEDGTKIRIGGPVTSYPWGGRWTYHVELLEIVHGDMLRVRTRGAIRDMRIFPIRSPQKDQPLGKEAVQWVERYFAENEVEINISQDMDQLEVGYVAGLLRAGLAWIKPDVDEQDVPPYIRAAQDDARRNMRGVWKPTEVVPPWERYKE